jgi:hypothetical protein
MVLTPAPLEKPRVLEEEWVTYEVSGSGASLGSSSQIHVAGETWKRKGNDSDGSVRTSVTRAPVYTAFDPAEKYSKIGNPKG